MSYHTGLDILGEPFCLNGIAYMNYNKAIKPNQHFRALLDPLRHLNTELIALLDQYNLCIRFAELFFTPAYRTTLIHVDSEPNEYMVPGNMAKINYISGGEDSMMHWYEPIVNKAYEDTGRNKFVSFQSDEVELVGSANLINYNIVQTGIPHNITTASKERYCVSLTLAIKGKTPKMLPYELLASTLSSISRAS